MAKKIKKSAKKPVKKVVKKAVKKIAKKSKPVKKAAKMLKKPAKKVVKKAVVKKLDKKDLKKLKLAKAKEAKLAKEAARKQKLLLKKEKEQAKKQKQKEKIAKAKEAKLEKQRLKDEKLAEKTAKAKAQKEAVKPVIKEEKKPNRTFKVGEYIVYPSHGIGKVLDIEKTLVLGQDFSCYLLYFEKEKLTIKIPLQNAAKVNLRPLVSKSEMEEVFSILRSGVKKLKGMWSRRAQEYEAKINSGDIIMLAEVLRDLTRDVDDGERSYSERIIYETAVARLAAEYATIYHISFEDARDKVISTAKDKLGSSDKSSNKDDGFDYDNKKLRDEDEDEGEDEEESEDDEDEDEDEDEDYEDDDYEDEDDDEPKKKRRK